MAAARKGRLYSNQINTPERLLQSLCELDILGFWAGQGDGSRHAQRLRGRRRRGRRCGHRHRHLHRVPHHAEIDPR